MGEGELCQLLVAVMSRRNESVSLFDLKLPGVRHNPPE